MSAPHSVLAHGAAVPAIGLGTYPLSGADCARAVAYALQQGYRHVDTAAIYGNEDGVGDGLRASGVAREAVFVTTKVWRDDLRGKALLAAADASLKRLRLDQVDLLLIHWPNSDIPLGETLAALAEAKRRGLTKHIGVSNFPAALLRQAVEQCDEPIVANQCEYHPRLDQTKLIAACRELGVAFVSYAPLAHAELMGDPAIARIAVAHRKTPGQIILRWHVQQPGVAAIPKSGREQGIKNNLDVFGFALSAQDMMDIAALRRRDGRLVDPGWAPDWDKP